MKGFDNTPFTTHEDLHVSYDMGNWELDNRNDEERVPEWTDADTQYVMIFFILALVLSMWVLLTLM